MEAVGGGGREGPDRGGEVRAFHFSTADRGGGGGAARGERLAAATHSNKIHPPHSHRGEFFSCYISLGVKCKFYVIIIYRYIFILTCFFCFFAGFSKNWT